MPYAHLDKQQQIALERVVGLLTTGVQAAPTPTRDRVCSRPGLPSSVRAVPRIHPVQSEHPHRRRARDGQDDAAPAITTCPVNWVGFKRPSR